MATEAPAKPKHGLFYKGTEIALGVTSAAALVINFIPGVDLLGISAALQGGVTLVQTAMDYKDKGAKKAAWTFGIGSLMTVAYLVPFLGAAGRLAGEGLEVAGNTEKVGMFGRMLGKVKDTAKGAGNYVGDKVPGFRRVTEIVGKGASDAKSWVGVNVPEIGRATTAVKDAGETYIRTPLKDMEVGLAKRVVKTSWLKPAVAKAEAHTTAAKAFEYGALGAGTVASVIKDTPPGSLINDLQDEGGGRKWAAREDAKREQAASAVPTVG